ncbi:hypothetical protein RQP46_003474 [Phenoliferia psychrophenolica]
MLFCTYLLRAHYRLSPLERLNSRSRAATFLLSDFFPIFCSLICGDLLQAIGFSLNVRWVAKDAFPLHPDSTCTAQAVLIQIGDVSSAFGSLLIGVHIALLLVLGIKIKRRILNYTIGFQWIVYGWAGGWCWISSHPSYQPFKLWLHYLWVFATAGVNLALYGAIFIKLARGNKLAAKHGGGGGTAAAARIMLFYPLVYIATIAPLGSFRIAALLGHTWSIHVQLAAGCIFTLSGFANCAVYAVTRNIVSSDTVNTLYTMSVAHAEAHQQDGDQKHTSGPEPTRFEEGKENSHLANDSKDQRSIANKLAAEEAKEKAEAAEDANKLRPTEIAESHGNKPSRGAKIDEQIENEEREELERKGKA